MENKNQTSEQAEVAEQKFSPLHTVTPLSKYLAMGLFITLPFVGGWIGYKYTPEKVVEVERVVKVEKEVNEVKSVENCTLVVREIIDSENETRKTARLLKGAAQSGDLIIDQQQCSQSDEVFFAPSSDFVSGSGNLYYLYDEDLHGTSTPALYRLNLDSTKPEKLFQTEDIYLVLEEIPNTPLPLYMTEDSVLDESDRFTTMIIHLNSVTNFPTDAEYDLLLLRYDNTRKIVDTAIRLPYSEQHEMIGLNRVRFKEVTLLGSFAEFAGTDIERRVVSEDWTVSEF